MIDVILAYVQAMLNGVPDVVITTEDENVIITTHDDRELMFRITEYVRRDESIRDRVIVRNDITQASPAYKIPLEHAILVAARLCRGSYPLPGQDVATLNDQATYTLEGYDEDERFHDGVAILSSQSDSSIIKTVPANEVFAVADVTETALALMGEIS
jgi:hypothetical protein